MASYIRSIYNSLPDVIATTRVRVVGASRGTNEPCWGPGCRVQIPQVAWRPHATTNLQDADDYIPVSKEDAECFSMWGVSLADEVGGWGSWEG